MQADPGRSPLTRFSQDLRDLSWLYVAQGVALLLLGVLILIFPELLAILVAAFLIVGGAVTLAAGWRVRQARRSFDDLGRLFWD